MTKFLSFKGPQMNVRTLTLAALLIALNVVLGKLSVGSDTVFKISLGFIATGMIGYFLGPWWGGVAMVVKDLIANTIFSSGSTFFLGFTFSAFVSGVIAGMILYQQKVSLKRLFAYEFVQILVTNVFFTTLWINILYTTPFIQLLTVRLPKEVISWPIEAIILFLVLRAVSRLNLQQKSGY
ncbi:folate family ECF transporter S component [Ligilactobacillus equi]|uniref:Uncharacterized protein n=2 Tax=Ligilactobacillus equi TaxID=137357 RepID=V7HXQ7_9LACO|nr:folate family ECF transporter S component [Ligilactobacillus equi]ETA73816.1 hypothetical protein LEQ_0915c [Ligilactobacillus equi DPC 6820]MCQ2557061.1 folate family ECF transporter S component [Ligilactobacillus sp.]